MKRALVVTLLGCLAASSFEGQKPSTTAPKHYKVAEADITGSVSPDGQFLSYTDWNTGDLAVRKLDTGESRHLTRKGSWLKSNEFALFSIFSPDGRQIAFGWFNGKVYELRVVGQDGGPFRILHRDEGVFYVEPRDWSPDGKYILVFLVAKGRGNQLGLVSVEDGGLRLFETSDGRFPFKAGFSPDGRYIAYDVSPLQGPPNRDIFVRPLGGGREVAIVKHPANDLLLGWSREGQGILFTSDRSGTRDLWFLPVVPGKAHGVPRLVQRDFGMVMHSLGFSHDSSYYYGVIQQRSDLYVATLDASTGKFQAPEKLVSQVGANTAADWSPDGQYLAYVSGHGRQPDPFSLHIRSLTTGMERKLSLPLTRFHAFQPRWSPDGRLIRVDGRNGPRQGFYAIDTRTGKVTPILLTETFCPSDCLEWPAWSPDESVIFFRWAKESVVLRELRTGQEKQLLHVAPPAMVSHLALSPDSQHLVYVWREPTNRKTALKIMPARGGEPRELVELKGPGSIVALAWVPDSEAIVYATSFATGKPRVELWRVTRRGGEPQNIGVAVEGLNLSGLSVDPEGRRIAFTAGTPDRSEVWAVRDFLPPPSR